MGLRKRLDDATSRYLWWRGLRRFQGAEPDLNEWRSPRVGFLVWFLILLGASILGWWIWWPVTF